VDLLHAMAVLPVSDAARRYHLGTHLLQATLEKNPRDVTCFPPSYFYPLGPVVSKHYFTERNDLDAFLTSVIRPETHVLHWYASVSNLQRFDRAYVETNSERNAYAKLCAQFLLED
jgi:hypothetical protein